MTYLSMDDFLRFQKKFPFANVCTPHGGVLARLGPMRCGELGGLSFHIYNGALGAPHMAFPRMSSVIGRDQYESPIGGAGSDEDVDLARVRSLAEALERYATCVLLEGEYIVASQRELGSSALDLAALPQCAPDEYASALHYMRPADPDAPVRWIKGISLLSGKQTYLPAIMTHLYGRAWESERFWVQITTGVAAHTDLQQALVSAICEVIERDAIAMTWLMRLALPRLCLDEPVPPRHARKFQALNRSIITNHFFDATTDIGVPTIYLVQTVEGNPRVAQFVNCVTDFSAWDATAKLIRESASGRTYLDANFSFPDDFNLFVDLSHGAAYMGRPEQRPHFDFLLQSRAARPISSIGSRELDTPQSQLRFLLDRFRELSMEVYAADLTTDELREAGLWVVRVLIPGLVPMSPIYSSRFLGHPRLYSYPPAAGFGPRTRADVNPLPQPFA